VASGTVAIHSICWSIVVGELMRSGSKPDLLNDLLGVVSTLKELSQSGARVSLRPEDVATSAIPSRSRL
jgi:hypothetical protein